MRALHDELSESHALNTHLQAAGELDRTQFRRQLHDELGGLMISTAMDLFTVSQQLAPSDPAQDELARARMTIQRAIDLSRRMVEDLRPSILDNIGLFAALQWQLKESSQDSMTVCTQSYPAVEPLLDPDISIGLFRVAQCALAMIFNRGSVKSADLHIHLENDTIFLQFTDDGLPVMTDGIELGTTDVLASMRHRMRVLGGTFTLVHTPGGSTVLTASIPFPVRPIPSH